MLELRLFIQTDTQQIIDSFSLSLPLSVFYVRFFFLQNSIVSWRTNFSSSFMWWLFVNSSTIGCIVAAMAWTITRENSDFFIETMNILSVQFEVTFTPYCLYHFIVIINFKNGSYSWMESAGAAARIETRSMNPMQSLCVWVCKHLTQNIMLCHDDTKEHCFHATLRSNVGK